MTIDLKALSESVENLADVCTRCGMCQAICPVYKNTRMESDSARGKLTLVSALHEEVTHSPRKTLNRLERCTLCGGCMATCPRGVSTVDAFLLARKALWEAGVLSGTKRELLRKAFADPAQTASLAARFAAVQKRFVKEDKARVASMGKYPVPKVRRPFLSERALEESTSAKGPRVLLFSGCLVDKAYSFVGEGLVGLLQEAGAQVEIPEGQGCCGVPLLSGGDFEGFSQAVKAHLPLFDPSSIDYIVTPCATCTHTLKVLWPKADEGLDESEMALAQAISKKVMDGGELLAMLGREAQEPVGDLSELTVTIHDPCHSRHSLKNTESVRELVRRCGCRLVEMEPGCCGLGGSFGISHRDLSLEIGQSCLDRMEATGADLVVTTCPGCMAQIESLLKTSGSSMRVRHAVELFTEEFS